MFKHDKALLKEVRVERPNPQYAVLMQEQLGGGNGELKAAMQYLAQSFRIKDPEIKDLFLDIAAEELSHMEMVATTFDMDYRLLEVEWALEDMGLTGISLANTFNINNRGGKTMALSRYEQAKIMILGGVYDKETLTKQLTRYLEKNLITKAEYDELISLMEAKELVTGE